MATEPIMLAHSFHHLVGFSSQCGAHTHWPPQSTQSNVNELAFSENVSHLYTKTTHIKQLQMPQFSSVYSFARKYVFVLCECARGRGRERVLEKLLSAFRLCCPWSAHKRQQKRRNYLRHSVIVVGVPLLWCCKFTRNSKSNLNNRNWNENEDFELIRIVCRHVCCSSIMAAGAGWLCVCVCDCFANNMIDSMRIKCRQQRV